MKYITVLGIGFSASLFFLSCRISKQKQEQLAVHAKTQEGIRQLSDRLVWQQQDSSESYWTLQTDSLLYYHPQWGLWTQGGILQGSHAQRQQSSVAMERDSIVREMEQEAQGRYTSHWSRQVKENWGLLV